MIKHVLISCTLAMALSMVPASTAFGQTYTNYSPSSPGGSSGFSLSFYPFPNGEAYGRGTTHDLHAQISDSDWYKYYVNGALSSEGWSADNTGAPLWTADNGGSINAGDPYNVVLTLPSYGAWVTVTMFANDIPITINPPDTGSRDDAVHTYAVTVASVDVYSTAIRTDYQLLYGGPNAIAGNEYRYPNGYFMEVECGINGSYKMRGFTDNVNDRNSTDGFYKPTEIFTVLNPPGLPGNKITNLYDYFQYMEGWDYDHHRTNPNLNRAPWINYQADGPSLACVSVPFTWGSRTAVAFLDGPGLKTGYFDDIAIEIWDVSEMYRDFTVFFYFDNILMRTVTWNRHIRIVPNDLSIPIEDQYWVPYLYNN